MFLTFNNDAFFCMISSLAKMRAKVWHQRTASPLFNIRHYAKDLENLLMKMWKRYEHGEAPDHITQ